MVNYIPLFYPPGALGIALGKALGLSPLDTLFFGRLCMLLVFLGIGAAALALARHGEMLLFALLTLPTAVSLGSSFNQDGLIIASGALAAALLTRANARPGNAAWLGAYFVLELIACAKLSYAVLFLACLPPLLAKDTPGRALLLALALLPPLLWLNHLLHVHALPWPRPAYHPGPLWPGDRTVWMHSVMFHNNIRVLRAHPVEILLLPLVSLWHFRLVTGWQIVAMLGWGGAFIWRWEYPALALSLLAAALGTALQPALATWRKRDYGLVALALAGTFIAVSLSLYVTANDAGVPVILGVAGRYYLPFLPFLVLLLPWGRHALPRRLAAGPAPTMLALPALLMAMVNSVALPLAIFHIYGMPGP